VVGLTGPACAGKSELSRILQAEAGLVALQLSAYVRREVELSCIDPSRADLQRVGDELRRTRGAGCLAEMALDDAAAAPGAPGFIVDGIRNPAEIETLRAGARFLLVGVDAPAEERFRRNIARHYLRQVDRAVFEAEDRRELGAGSPPEWGQNIGRCLEVARSAPFGVYIYNDGTPRQLKERAREVLRRVTGLKGAPAPAPGEAGKAG